MGVSCSEANGLLSNILLEEEHSAFPKLWEHFYLLCERVKEHICHSNRILTSSICMDDRPTISFILPS